MSTVKFPLQCKFLENLVTLSIAAFRQQKRTSTKKSKPTAWKNGTKFFYKFLENLVTLSIAAFRQQKRSSTKKSKPTAWKNDTKKYHLEKRSAIAAAANG